MSGYNSHVLDLDQLNFGEDKTLILKYRLAAAQPECDIAINDIVNGAIIGNSKSAPVKLNLDEVDLSDKIKDSIRNEFGTILRLLKFNFESHDIFRRWYVDGKLYYHIITDKKKLNEGIKELRYIDPVKIKKVKEVENKTEKQSGRRSSEVIDEYYIYSDNLGATGQGLKIASDAIVHVPSGILNAEGSTAISYLDKSVKLVNQLRTMEDALVIYRISRAPERRIFYIDVGNLPKGKSEEYVQGIMAKFKNKLVYDAGSGEIKDDRKSMSMLEDFWLPRREGGRGTEITTLPGGENLGQIEDVVFFQKKLYRSLNVPAGRLDSENVYSAGRASEISREEVKFQKFIDKLRRRFSLLFINALKVQCILKRICDRDDWEEIEATLSVNYIEDNFFSELKDFEILRERITMLEQVEPYIGKFYSDKWVRANILNLTEEDIERIADENAEDTDGDDDDLDEAKKATKELDEEDSIKDDF